MLLANASAQLCTLLIFAITLVYILIGNPIAFALMGGAATVGVMTLGVKVFDMFTSGVYVQATNYDMLAVPLFVFMGNMIEVTGITKRMFDAMYVWIGKIRGGLLVVTIIIGVILAACVGVVAASVVMLGLIGLPMMMERGYNKSLSAGAICSAGSLGILIPPSIMLVMYGPSASLSVGKLFMGAFVPGFLLGALYTGYNLVACAINPKLAPAAGHDDELTSLPISKKLMVTLTGLLPPVLLILAVLGSIMFGIAAPTEAAAVGALVAVIMAICYRKFTLQNFHKALYDTAQNYAMVQMIAWAAKAFTILFLRLGCGNVVSDVIMAVPGGRWASFAVIMLIVFILGMFIDWLGIILILIPIVTPLAAEMGFDAIWFAMMIIINLQLSFITPPFAYAIFFLKGICRPEWGIETIDIVKGIVPYLALIAVCLILCIIFPQIITWLPNLTIR